MREQPEEEIKVSKMPWRIATDQSVRDRVRRLPTDTHVHREAKRLVREDNDTLGALKWLRQYNLVTDEHVWAHERWLTQQSGEDLV
jgi:hypothetical protein